ncbi:peptidase C69 [Lactobacillus delbrueckii subsp. bulgaricus]|nr:peptidase C69 [Lactobacillus delbrueckii subsp. bulgaricus]
MAAAFTATSVKACTTVVVGKKATTDGSTLVARNEDVGAWSKHFYVHQATSNGPTTYVSEDNGLKTSLPKTALRYTSTPDGEQVNGQWIFGESGINSENVAMSATESGTTNKKGLKADNLVKNGISEASMLDVILPYIHSAKEGVQRLGQIVEKQGSAENNGVIFSDKNEIWYKVSPDKVGQVLSSHFTGTKYSSYGKWKAGYRPINVPTDVESHILQIRNNVPKEYAAIQWLAMASPANSVYLPFYTNISDTPSQYKVDGDYQDPTNTKSAYWTYKTTAMVVEAYKHKKFIDSSTGKKTDLIYKDVNPTKKTVTKQLKANLAQSDKVAKTLSGDKLTAYLTEQNQKNADYAQKKWQTMNNSLIVHSNKLAPVTKSKLTFNK